MIIPSCLHAFYFVDIKVHFQAPCSSATEENNFMVKDLLLCCWKFHNIYNLGRLHQRILQNCTLIMPQFFIVFWYCHYCCLCLKFLVTPAGIFCRLQVANVTKIRKPLALTKLRNLDTHQASVVQTVDNAIHRINYYPLDIAIGFAITYPVDSDLSGG